MEEYEFSGRAKLGNEWQKFERKIEAYSEEHAREKLLSELGSEHGITRGQIKME